MSDLQIDICEAIEKVLCEKLDMPSCEGTYEIAVDIFNAAIHVIDGATVVLPENLARSYTKQED